MSEMVERVARVICKMGDNDPPSVGGDPFCCGQCKSMLEVARAAIEAMREPTEAMVAAPIHDEIEAIWKAMIDEARK